MEIKFKGKILADKEKINGKETIVIKTEHPVCRIHSKTKQLKEEMIPDTGEMVECILKIEEISKGNIYGTISKIKKFKKWKKI